MGEKSPYSYLISLIQNDLSEQLALYQKKSWQAYSMHIFIHIAILIISIGILVFSAWLGLAFGSRAFKQFLSAFLIIISFFSLIYLARFNFQQEVRQRLSDSTHINLILIEYIYQIIHLVSILSPNETMSKDKYKGEVPLALEKLNQITENTIDLLSRWIEEMENGL